MYCIISETNNVFGFNRVDVKSLKTHRSYKKDLYALTEIKITTTPQHKNNAVGLHI